MASQQEASTYCSLPITTLHENVQRNSRHSGPHSPQSPRAPPPRYASTTDSGVSISHRAFASANSWPTGAARRAFMPPRQRRAVVRNGLFDGLDGRRARTPHRPMMKPGYDAQGRCCISMSPLGKAHRAPHRRLEIFPCLRFYSISSSTESFEIRQIEHLWFVGIRCGIRFWGIGTLHKTREESCRRD